VSRARHPVGDRGAASRGRDLAGIHDLPPVETQIRAEVITVTGEEEVLTGMLEW
jgi:hypothetical protein